MGIDTQDENVNAMPATTAPAIPKAICCFLMIIILLVNRYGNTQIFSKFELAGYTYKNENCKLPILTDAFNYTT
ncbi:hypothetical protein GCM10011425_06420 [Mucilaginibacter galii]|uniref:Uncharacterized protein n=1 Tax=Mucilaginibacter galii TaxID=2005073 RepID=A0A917N051_9SPHI|nr:hypothetical protein GCM10011425_06420 [Mucilaginibacter galii]